jgi:glycosyltransferase involved in cell wall biosynthesis
MNNTNTRTRIMHYYTYPENSGGPLTYIYSIINSTLNSKYLFGLCFQNSALSRMSIKKIRRVINEIRAFNPYIIHIHGLQGEGLIGLIAAKRAKVPVILTTVHGMQHNSITISWVKRVIFKYILEPYVLHKSDAVYCVSEEMENREYIKKHTKNLLPYINNFIPRNDEISTTKKNRKSLNIMENEFVIIVVGRISIDKGMRTIEKCIEYCDIPNVRFILAGDGVYRKEMEEKMQNHTNKLLFTGQITNVADYLSIADVYLSASLHENFSIALLEACYNSLPSIVTDVGDNTKVVKNGYNGFVVKKYDYNEIIANLQFLFNNSKVRKEMGENSRNFVIDNFSEEIFIKKLDSVYSSFEGL